uniref:Uncharacterized protein n=1 Tax=Cucumis sativus TaxID=3659 RepID=A0A0A0KYX7_CUCSA
MADSSISMALLTSLPAAPTSPCISTVCFIDNPNILMGNLNLSLISIAPPWLSVLTHCSLPWLLSVAITKSLMLPISFSRAIMTCPFFTSQTQMLPSSAADIKCFPSFTMTIETTAASCFVDHGISSELVPVRCLFLCLNERLYTKSLEICGISS